MKKTLLLLASAALLLVGCAKEQLSNSLEGELTKVTFTASLDSGVATKAVADGDGAAASVNRCIMEIYYGGERFARQIAPVNVVNNKKTASFTAQVVSNRTYTVAFWADCVDDANTDAGRAVDKYYTTNAEGGLTAITLKGTYAGNDDARDAFFICKDDCIVAQAGTAFEATLKRPFAQMNVITTDWDKVTIVDALKPGQVNVTIKNPMVKFNAVTGEASADANTATLNYTADVYVAPASTGTAPANEKTLSMDYLFASTTKEFIDIDWKALHGEDTPVAHSFAAVPYQRNYRTNIKGALLTTQGQWTVEVDPIWETDTNGDFDYAYTSVYDIQGANDFVAQNQDKKEISVTFSTQPNDAGDPSEGTDEHPINAIVTSLLKQGATYNIDVASTTDKLYVGDYDYSQVGGIFTYDYHEVLPENSEKTNAAAVNLVVTDNLYIGTLVVNSPSKSVSINGQTVQSGKTYHIANLQVQEVSMNTVVIEKGMVVEKLEMIKGGLEIHGTVHKATVPEGTPIADIKVRDCENLDETLVYNVLKEYIAEGYVGVKGRTTEGLWDIVPIVCKIDEIGYGTLADAVAKVQEGQTITLVKDVENAVGIAINTGKTFTIDFNNHKYTVNKPGAGSTGTQTAAFQLIKGQTITFKNGIIKAAEDNLTAAVAPAKNIKRMFQSYANITFEGMIIDGTNLYENNSVCEFACGAVDIKGTTSITTGKQGVAVINVDTWKGAYPEGAQVTISSTGEFGDIYLYAEESGDYTKSSLTITDGKFDKVYGDDSGDWTASISGGVFSEKPADEIVAAGYAVLDNPDATTKAQYPWTVDRKGVAKIGTTIYYDLKDAIDAVPAGTETETMITMLDNVAGTATFTIPSNKNICLELNGRSIYASSNIQSTFYLFENQGIFTIQDNSDTQKNGTGTGKLTTVAYNPDMQPVPGYATNTITNYGTLTVKSGLIESGSDGKASYAIDNDAENAKYHGNNQTVKLTVTGGKIVSGASQSIRMYLETAGNYDNVINISNAHIGSLWVQDNYGATAAKGSLTISDSKFDNMLDIGYEQYCEHISVNVSDTEFGGKVHYWLDPEAEGNTIHFSNISATPFFMDFPKKVLSDGSVTIKGEFTYGWKYIADEAAKTEFENQGWRFGSNSGHWYVGYLTETGVLNVLKECIVDGYEAVCVDQTAGKYEIRVKQQ